MRIVISGIPIDVQKKNIKNMHLQVKPPDGHVVISAPLSVDDKAIEAYARTQLGFIKRSIAQFQDQPRASKRQYVSGETMYIWGKQYFLVFKARIKYKALQDGYDELFGYKISANELINLLNSFVNETNSILCGDYDCYANDKDTLEALADFKDRYKHQVDQIDDIMLEDWLFVVHMFFLKNTDLEENRQAAVQGF